MKETKEISIDGLQLNEAVDEQLETVVDERVDEATPNTVEKQVDRVMGGVVGVVVTFVLTIAVVQTLLPLWISVPLALLAMTGVLVSLVKLGESVTGVIIGVINHIQG